MIHDRDVLASPEYTAEDSASLERLDQSIRASIELLDNPLVTPDTETRRFTDIPFGKWGGGFLTMYCEYSSGCSAITICNKPSPRDESGREFVVQYDLAAHHAPRTNRPEEKTPHWHIGKRCQTTHAVLQALDASWPQSIYDNTSIRNLIKDTPAEVDAVCRVLTQELAPYAASTETKKTFRYNHLTIADTIKDTIATTKLELVTSYDSETSNTTITATISLPYFVDLTTSARDYCTNMCEVTLVCDIILGENSLPRLVTHYSHPETGKETIVQIHNPTGFVTEVEAMIASLLDEKLGVFGN